ncbi:MAG: amino acid adenylation domain-containing protein [Burkholderiaceae bacterium]
MTHQDQAPAPDSELSSAEQSIWIGQKLRPSDPLYNMALLVQVEGEVRPDTFRAAFASVVSRNDALRTTFHENDGAVSRVVLESIELPLQLLDFSDKPNAESEALRWCESRTQHPFELSGPPFECVLIRLGRQQQTLYFNAHHLISDAISTALVVKELGLAYARLVAHQPPAANSERPQYADFLLKRRDVARAPLHQEAVKFWRGQLDRLSQSPQAPIEFYKPTPASVSTRSARLAYRLSSQQVEKLEQLSRNPETRALTRDMSISNIFTSTLLALMHRLSGRDSIVIGMPAANRHTKATKQTIGLFVELFPLQTCIEPDESFNSLLRKVRDESNALLMNAMPGAGHPDALRSFSTVLNYINAKIEFSDFKTQTSWLHPGSADAAHHLRLEVHDFDTTGQTSLLFDLNESVFDEAARTWLLQHFDLLFNAFLDTPERAISTVSLLGQTDAASARLAASSVKPNQLASDQTIVSVFDAQALSTPEKPALITDTETLTYQRLAALAGQLAGQLINQHGIKAGDVVAILTNRGAETIAGILGVLKSGAAYVPIDPSYPKQRIEQILTDCQARVLIGPNEHAQTLVSAGVSNMVVSLTEKSSAPDEPFKSPAMTGSDLAYVLYTSGTTGAPNGVLVEHRNVLSLVEGLNARAVPQEGRALNIALVAPFVFDASVQQIFSSLLLGHSLHIVPEKARLNGLELRAFYARHEIDVTDGTPAHLSLIAEAGAGTSTAEPLPLPGRFILGGDRMTSGQLKAFYGAVTPAKPEIINIYGVAECTVDSSAYRVNSAALEQLEEHVPVGTPLLNTQILILSEKGLVEPAGVAGEIAIAGSGVSRGYLNRPDLTQAKFVSHPLDESSRMYLTGDRGRIDEHGTLHFLGRLDDQIKSRGIRIEPAEIEHHLMAYQSKANASINIIPISNLPVTERCQSCLLTTQHPEVKLNKHGICNVCESWSDYESASRAYFQTPADFQTLCNTARLERRQNDYDCMLLYSGGKDSSYVLHRLVDLGLKVLAFTFDNGFISNAAFENIRRQTESLGVESIVERASAMDEIFVESLLADSTVCSGCFRALTAISTRLAHEHGINMVVTGLSRGQIFDTKLAGLYQQGITQVEEVEKNLQLFRKVFHANEDRTAQLLAVDLDEVEIDSIHFVDFFRYDSIGVNGVRRYLQAKDDYWSQPQDTGFCSSNCVMNDVGICMHSSQRGFHNYEAPLSWDIRLGVSQRYEVLPEVTTPVSLKQSEKILNRIGFFKTQVQAARVLGADPQKGTDHLTAYFQASQEITAEDLRQFLSERLPNYLVPSRYVQVTRMPYTANGKIDDRLLRQNDQTKTHSNEFRAPANEAESVLAKIWAEVLQLKDVGVNDNFFDLGGDSIAAIRIVGRANSTGLNIEANQLLETQTVAKLAASTTRRAPTSQEPVSGDVALTPILDWFLSGSNPESLDSLNAFSQVMSVRLSDRPDQAILSQALQAVVQHHDALRIKFTFNQGRWQAVNCAELPTPPMVAFLEAGSSPAEGRDQAISRLASELDVAQPALIQAAILSGNDDTELLLVANHLVIDAISWSVLLEDLASAYKQLESGKAVSLPPKSSSFQAWASCLAEYANKPPLEPEAQYWRGIGQSKPFHIPGISDAPDLDIQASATSQTTSLSYAETAELLSIASQRKRSVHELLLIAIGTVLSIHTGQVSVQIDVEGHGREPFPGAPSIARTVGWFTSLYPLFLQFEGDNQAAATDSLTLDTINRLTDQIRAVPSNGFGYGVLNHMTQSTMPNNLDSSIASSPVLFNYLGQSNVSDQATVKNWQPQPLRLYRAPAMQRRHPVEIAAWVHQGALSFEWTHTSGKAQDAIVSRLAEHTLALLREAARLLTETAQTEKSAADFPQAKLDSKGLDKLAAALGKADAAAIKRTKR